MKAVLIRNKIGPAEDLYIGEADKPIAGQGELVIKVTSMVVTSMCPLSDAYDARLWPLA
ncbi:hypothetical protein DL93DRAFT_2078788 [Clavulina sp. PMI_390]|nr:hypothetical protein DL93DRAFT_2078788 [Clavulina sp. PMI_390]